MAQINSLILPGQAPLKVAKDMNGNILLGFRDNWARLTPKEGHDFAVVVLKALGFEVQEPPKRDADIGGKELKARIKMVF